MCGMSVIATLLAATLTFRPERIVFGGGVMAQNHMVERVRHRAFIIIKWICTNATSEGILLPNNSAVDNGSATLGNLY